MKKAAAILRLIGNFSGKKGHGIRILHNLGANALAQGINAFGQLLLVPIFLYFWGKELYGEWILLSTIPAYFAMNDLCFSHAGATEMTVLAARNERTAALEVFQSIWVLVSSASLLLLLAISAVLMWVPVADWLNITQLNHRESTLVVLLLVCNAAISQQIGLLQAGFRCGGANALGVNWYNAFRIVELLLTAGVVACGGQPFVAAAANLLTRLIGFALMRAHLYRLGPWLRFGWSHARFTHIRRLTGPALAFMAFPLGNALKNQGIVIVIGRCLGPVGVVAFTTTRTLTNAVFQLMGIIHSSVWPEMSAAFGAGDLDLAKGLHRHSCRASFWLSMGGVTSLFLFGGWIYSFWTHGNLELNLPLFYQLLVVIVANSFWYTSSVVPMAINCHQRTAFWYLAGSGMALALATLILPRWGLAGAGFALLALDAVMIFNVLPHSLALVHDRFAEFALAVMKPPYRLAWRY